MKRTYRPQLLAIEYAVLSGALALLRGRLREPDGLELLATLHPLATPERVEKLADKLARAFEETPA